MKLKIKIDLTCKNFFQVQKEGNRQVRKLLNALGCTTLKKNKEKKKKSMKY